MAMTSTGGSGFDFAPFRNPSRDMNAKRAGREMSMDVSEQDAGFEIKADLPGISKNDIKVHVDLDKVIVTVEKSSDRTEDTNDQGVRYYRAQRSSHYLRRTVRLPESANLEQLKARFENGVLQLTVPKKGSLPSQQTTDSPQ